MGPPVVVFLDASAISYLLEGDAATRASVQATLAALRERGDPPLLAVSALSRVECRVRPLRDSDEALLRRYEDFFTDPGLIVIALDAVVLDRAAELRAHRRLRTPDAFAGSLVAGNRPAGIFRNRRPGPRRCTRSTRASCRGQMSISRMGGG